MSDKPKTAEEWVKELRAKITTTVIFVDEDGKVSEELTESVEAILAQGRAEERERVEKALQRIQCDVLEDESHDGCECKECSVRREIMNRPQRLFLKKLIEAVNNG